MAFTILVSGASGTVGHGILKYLRANLPVATDSSANILCLPICAEPTAGEQDAIIGIIRGAAAL